MKKITLYSLAILALMLSLYTSPAQVLNVANPAQQGLVKTAPYLSLWGQQWLTNGDSYIAAQMLLADTNAADYFMGLLIGAGAQFTTNGLASIPYVQASTNGFVDKSITNGFAPKSYVDQQIANATNGLAGSGSVTNLPNTITNNIAALNSVTAPTVSSTNFSGNASALTNLPAPALVGSVPLASLPSAVVTNNGTATGVNLVTPTGYDITRANVVASRNSISMVTPLDTWVVLGGWYNEANVLGWMTNMLTAGYPTNMSYSILMDESWMGGHSNGIPYMNLTNFPDGFSYLTTNLHNHGFGIEYFLTLGTNGVLGPGSAGYEFSDAAWLTTNGADGLYLVDDAEQYTASGIPANRYWLAVNGSRSTGRYIPIKGTTYIQGLGNLHNSFDSRFVTELPDGQNMVFPSYTDGLGTTYAMVDTIYWWDQYKFLIYPGHRLMHGWMGTGFSLDGYGPADQWVTRAEWGVVAMYHGKFSWAIPQSPVNPPSYGWEMITNTFLTNVDSDISFTVPTIFTGTLTTNSMTSPNTATNTIGLVEGLHDGTIVFGVWNQATNALSTNTILVNFTNAVPPYGNGLGIAGNDYTVTDGWTMASFDCQSNMLSVTVPPEGFQWFSLTLNNSSASSFANATNVPVFSITNQWGNQLNFYSTPSNWVMQAGLPANGIDKIVMWTNGAFSFGNGALSSGMPTYEHALFDGTIFPESPFGLYFDTRDWLDSSSNNWIRAVVNNGGGTFFFGGNGNQTNSGQMFATGFNGSGAGLTNLNSFFAPTNSFTGALFPVNATNWIPILTTNGFTGFSDVSGAAAGGISGGSMRIIASANLTITNPPNWFTSDGLTTRTLTNGNLGTISVEVVPGVMTNLNFIQANHN